MNERLNFTLRTVPLSVVSVIAVYILIYVNKGNTFDFWTPMINIQVNILDWFFAGVFNCLFLFLLNLMRILIAKFSFQDLNENIPQSDTWEKMQFNLLVLSFFIVIFLGITLSIAIITSEMFQFLLFYLIVILFLQDLGFHIKWIIF